MTAWITPATFVDDTVLAAALLNAEVRDHASWLKGFAANITGATDSDTGTATKLAITRALSTEVVLEGKVTGDTNPRFQVLASGKVGWGAGGASALDAFLERASANVLLLNDASLRVERAAVNFAFLGGRVTGDTNDRITLGTDASGRARLQMQDGATTPTTVLLFDPGGSPTLHAAVLSNGALIENGKYLAFGTSDSAEFWLYRPSGNKLELTDALLSAPGGVTTLVKAGVPVDGDFPATPASGTIAVDTTNSRIYVRVGSTWKFVAVA